MNNLDDLRRFVESVVDESTASADLTLLEVAIAEPDVAILAYSWGALSERFGRIYRWSDLTEINDDEEISPEDYALEVVTVDLQSPPGDGVAICFPWEHMFVGSRGPIRWCGVVGDFSGLRPFLIDAHGENARQEAGR
ncbi:hypothetical protein [Leucobacter sp.]